MGGIKKKEKGNYFGYGERKKKLRKGGKDENRYVNEGGKEQRRKEK